jgi:glycosyltransferase involved in cell wall biosynthesis
MISFVILTIGSKPEKLARCIRSIKSNFNSNELYEVILVGNNVPPIELGGVRVIEDLEKKEFLGARKNIGTENSRGDILVHCDDDIIFPDYWFNNFNSFNKSNDDWEIMGNRVLLPDGGRYWDRSIYFPVHQMVDYDFYSDDVTFYQSGAFSICKRSLFDTIKWSDEIPFYGMFKGFEYNEDIEFSIRLKEMGYKIFFDKNNKVWHDDSSYLSNGVTCNKKQNNNDLAHKCLDFVLETNL